MWPARLPGLLLPYLNLFSSDFVQNLNCVLRVEGRERGNFPIRLLLLKRTRKGPSRGFGCRDQVEAGGGGGC